MNNKLIQPPESDCKIVSPFFKAQIIGRGTEHPAFHRVEMYNEVEILSLTPYLDRGIVCLPCKLQGGVIISIPIEWLQMLEE